MGYESVTYMKTLNPRTAFLEKSLSTHPRQRDPTTKQKGYMLSEVSKLFRHSRETRNERFHLRKHVAEIQVAYTLLPCNSR